MQQGDILVGAGLTPEGAGASSDPRFLTDGGGILYFTAWEIREDTDGVSIFRSDGTAGGTQHLGARRYFAGATETWHSGDLESVGGRLIYTDGDQLGRSDGTFEGTDWYTEIYYAGDGLVDDLRDFGGSAFFPAREGGLGQELWRTHGAEATPEMLANIAPSYESSTPRFLTSSGGRLYFSASDGAHGFELWSTDGTAAGTVLVNDLRPGEESSDPMYLTDIGGELAFTARSDESGYELVVSEASSGTTGMVQDIAPGPRSSEILELTRSGDLLFFSADDGVRGHELWTVPISELVPATQADLALTKSDPPGRAPTGRNLTYTLTATNGGPDAAFEVTVVDQLPAAVTYVSATPSQGSCGHSSGTVTCTLGTIGNGGTATINIVVKPSTPGMITNTASVSASTSDPNAGNNMDSESTSVCRITSRRSSIPCP
jgi:uncharacterized repeat protein (TIGR01451 family)